MALIPMRMEQTRSQKGARKRIAYEQTIVSNASDLVTHFRARGAEKCATRDLSTNERASIASSTSMTLPLATLSDGAIIHRNLDNLAVGRQVVPNAEEPRRERIARLHRRQCVASR